MIIENTPKLDIITAIDKEIVQVRSLLDTILLVRDSGKVTLEDIDRCVSKNAVLNGIQNDFKKRLSPHAEFLPTIERAANQLTLWLPKLRQRIVNSNTKTYDKETITFKENGILQAISTLDYFNDYAVMVMDILLTLSSDPKEQLKSYLNKVDFNLLNDTSKYFSHLVIKYNSSIKELEGYIDNLSDEVYDNVSEEIIKAQLGVDAVSVQNSLAPHELNPLFWWRFHRMKKHVDIIQANNEKIEMLALKIARINNKRNGAEDPSLDHQIEVYQNEIIKKRAQIVRIEDKYRG